MCVCESASETSIDARADYGRYARGDGGSGCAGMVVVVVVRAHWKPIARRATPKCDGVTEAPHHHTCNVKCTAAASRGITQRRCNNFIISYLCVYVWNDERRDLRRRRQSKCILGISCAHFCYFWVLFAVRPFRRYNWWPVIGKSLNRF